ncbi:TMV resistance protein N-like [Cornus florida]|uniref:TMV resistance protein N-like n=1 Tax=Cornus florida TaxID=4283 RepID=UPI0028984C32|nr:TMV resistance protein N-like [Cornus florida]
MATASSSFSLSQSEYEVFLSFRGEDTRKSFVGHLYTALDQRGIRTFKDDERLEQGKSISFDLWKSINESSIAVIVFSEKYANSSWCLDELVEILDCSKTKGLIVLPIFYHVKPSEVRYQKRSYAEAFRQHEEIYKVEMERMQKWRSALKEVANLSGFDLEDEANGYVHIYIYTRCICSASISHLLTTYYQMDMSIFNCRKPVVRSVISALIIIIRIKDKKYPFIIYKIYEDKFIKSIVQVILEKLQPKPFRVTDYEVGINARVDKVISLLEEDKLFVGICGIGGAGKTTVAKAIFNRISKIFGRSCFLENVREESTNHSGLAKLQCNFLREILMDKNITISYPDRGINEIKERLRNKRLLLVLDDVEKENTLKYLVGDVGEEWFGNGSRIIITTRDKRLLEKYNVGIYDIEVLNDIEALELFSWHAFKQNKPKEEYEKLSHHAKNYAKGLPLALQVLGSYLSNRSKQDCLTILNRLQTKPPKEIHEVLRISYEGLDKEEKDIFLDIACFFKGYNKKYVLDFSKRPEFDTAFGIQILRERCLINISKDNKLSMHDLIQEMGREIVRQESDDPGRRSRLWSYADISEVFTENTVHVKGIYVSFLISMCKMFPFLEKLCLKGCESLVEVGFDDKKFQDKLKLVDLSYCTNLKKTPNLSGLPFSKKCENLKILATRINLKSLEVLSLAGCSKFEKCPEIHRDMKSLKELYLYESPIKDLSPSIVQLEGLIELRLCHCKMLGSLSDNIGEMKSLRKLWLSGSGVKKLPSSFAQLSILELYWRYSNLDEESILNLPHSLWKLDLSRNDFVSLRSSFSQLTDLYELVLDDCVRLQTLESLPSSIRCLSLCGCSSLQTLSLPEFTTEVLAQGCVSLEGYSIRTSDGCNFNFNLTENHGNGNGNKKPNIYYSKSEDLPAGGSNGEVFFPGSEIPSWFSHIKYESDGVDMTWVCLRIYSNSLRYLKGVSVCAVIGNEKPFDDEDDNNDKYKNSLCIHINGKYEEGGRPGYLIGDWINRTTSDFIMLLHTPNTGWMCDSDGWCYIKASIDGSYPDGRLLKVKKWGIHPVMNPQYYLEHINGPTIEFVQSQ